MAYPGIALALIVGFAVGSMIYSYFTQETPQAYSSKIDDAQVPNSWNTTSSRSSPSSQRRRNKLKQARGHLCSICQEELSGRTQFLKCGHEFHPNCIQNLFLNNFHVCPNCRRNI